MNKRKYSKTELGMMYGVMIGGAIGAVMLTLTGEVLWLGAEGVGVALDLGIGASLDKSGS